MTDKGEKKKRGGRRPGAGRKKGDPEHTGAAGTTPEQFMRMMVPADHVHAEKVPPGEGFGEVQPKVDPVEFCLAVINNDRRVLTQCGVTEFPTLDQQLFAARVAVKFTNKSKPVEVVSKHQFSWVDEISAAEQRVRDLRKNVNDDPTNSIN